MRRDSNFRYVYTNAIQIGLSDHDIKLIFGISEELEGSPDNSIDQVGVGMTLPTAKLLGLLLAKVIEAHETISGREIPVDPAKAKAIEDMLAAAKEARDASTNE